ncbi:PilZ domain-containing protein [Sphingomonas sp. LHG3406-1]|uniref:PilZ domain-containing protein n=1 Tax=Sphingomonas sp. LHG3406-1 TaxID=2804617 RepID=UPI002616BD9F|nr:PilZ domain-containing protein [Sphingomonas sp. LHG3406-1]
MDDQDWTVRRTRQPVEIEARVHSSDGRESPILVTNLSADGCCVDGTFGIGDFLDITIPELGRRRGQVRWAIGNQAGIRFLAPLEADGG